MQSRQSTSARLSAARLSPTRRSRSGLNLEPWTRDGRVRADIVEVSPDVNGLVTAVLVRDNQTVRVGQIL
ncbi:MAG: biotin/lipoyl-binding protein, partial [Sinobacteraceae bacterium]|nr:biotin/lipoyl-binding protein [Nevskiaceae bacterium]